MADIKDTLLQKLFLGRPTGALYEKFFGEIFPDRDVFMEFLKERDCERQVELADKILARLSYESFVFPCYRLLRNLHNTEFQLTSNRKRGDFIGRDHFVHLVNLYILGIYSFFYNIKLQKVVLRQFVDKQSNEMRFRRKATRQTAGCRDFLDCWRIFVLFHDVGYPWEAPNALEGRQDIFLKPFRRLAPLYAKEISLRYLARTICLKQILEERAGCLLRSDLSGFHLKEGRSSHKTQRELAAASELTDITGLQPLTNSAMIEIGEKFGQYERLSSLQGPAFYACVNSSFSSELLLAVCEENEREALVAVVLPPSSPGGKRTVIGALDLMAKLELDYDSLVQYAFSGYAPLDGAAFHWTYYALDPSKEFQQRLRRTLQQNPKRVADFDAVVSRLSESVPLRYSIISNEEELRDHLFYVYNSLSDPEDDLDEQNSMLAEQQIRGDAVRAFAPKVVPEIAALLGRKLEAAAKERINARSMRSVVTQLIRSLGNRAMLANDIVEVLNHKMSQEFEATIASRRLQGFLCDAVLKQPHERTGFRAHREGTKAVGGISDSRPNEVSVLEMSNSGIMPSIDKSLAKCGLGTASKMCSYVPPFGEGVKGFLDHGVASALLLNDCSSLIRSLDTSLLRGREDGTCAKVTKHKLDVVVPEAAFAILIHNIYPEYLKETDRKRYRTDLSKNPFAYFAILCDSLQPWDRKRLCTIQDRVRPYSTYSAVFNIEIVNDVFYVSECADGLDVKLRYDSLKKHLDHFLKNASHLVRVRLGEYRIA